jgi:RNA polymerase sigma factor (sigma-70 family)
VSDSGPEERSQPGGQNFRTPEEWAEVVEQIRVADPAGEEALYSTLMGGARFLFRRQAGTEDVDDLVHNLFLTVVDGIRRGQLREPPRLMGFVRTILFRQASAHRQNRAQAGASLSPELSGSLQHPGADPERSLMEQEKRELMRKLILELRPRDREILERFYLAGQSEEQIRGEMELSANQFRLLKSRAKDRFQELVRERLRRPRISQR